MITLGEKQGEVVLTLDGKRVLVTGGTGSMGKVFVRRALSGEFGTPKKVMVFSRDEAKQHEMRIAYLHQRVVTDEVIYRNFQNILEFRIGDVRDYSSICAAVRDADIVINAAALKQVPTCEYFPAEAVRTNCLGPANIVRAVTEMGFPVETVVCVSTDKACKPVNAMGMTKALQERIFVAANISCPETRFVGVRYGNVMASRGSVIPLFHQQILAGGPVTITVPEMTRFLLTIEQAADTVFAVLAQAHAGEIYIPRVPSATVINLARALIGDHNIKTEIIGVRPGEKMHEILVSEEEYHRVVGRGDYLAILPMLPELGSDEQAPDRILDKEYSSADHVLELAATVSLLEKHDLMVGTTNLAEGGELLR